MITTKYTNWHDILTDGPYMGKRIEAVSRNIDPWYVKELMNNGDFPDTAMNRGYIKADIESAYMRGASHTLIISRVTDPDVYFHQNEEP